MMVILVVNEFLELYRVVDVGVVVSFMSRFGEFIWFVC